MYRCKGKKVTQEGEFVGRKDCGRDLTPVVEVVKRDGKLHTVRCKHCGNCAQVVRIAERAV